MSETLEYLIQSNVNVADPFFAQFRDAKLKRWQGLIPVKLNGDPMVEQALNEINRRLGRTMFDRVSIQARDDAAIVSGLIFSEGTAFQPAGKTLADNKGNVSDNKIGMLDGHGGWPRACLSNSVISARFYVNYGSATAAATTNIVIHEIGHAMGLLAHFPGFGEGADIGKEFWPVLRLLYNSAIGTSLKQLVRQG
ncbi:MULTISPECIES: hypothetical protein [unclassified Janthinobacterium]|uniref:hypothetical protein n=1 Tax=unclassified Janthinobacterium TaxID=2610881 RepID=UPI0003472263|nr:MULTISPECIES: hypothetical protein [unclassified Janthinobacterium]MEC5162884.1 hypothetical protein [Janthinobacterium sp. CG_S6]